MTGKLKMIGAAALIGLLAVGCGEDSKKKASARVQFANKTTSAMTASAFGGTTPGVFGVKLIAIYLVENIDAQMNNVGALSRIWTNPACDADLSLCGPGPAAGAYQINDYFDLTRTTAALNTELNSQFKEVQPGTYRYIRIDLCGATGAQTDTSAANVRFGATNDASLATAVRGQGTCGLDFPLATPYEIQAGATVTFNLEFSIADNLITGNPAVKPASVSAEDWLCNPGNTVCMVMPTFSPTVN